MSRNSKKINKKPHSEYTGDPIEEQEEQEEAPQPTPPPARRAANNKENPFGISFVVPTETVILPTRGHYYPVGSPLHGVETVEIKHMTAKEEDILSLNDRGTDSNINAFDKVVDSLIQPYSNGRFTAEDMSEEDKVAILLAARATGYGKDYKVAITCENCNATSDQTFDLTKVSIKEPEISDAYNPETDSFRHHLKLCDVEVELENLNPLHTKEIQQDIKNKEKHKIPYNYTVLFLQKMIISANSVTDRKLINQLIQVMPAADAKSISSFYEKCRPTISTAQEITCPKCGFVSEREAPFSWAFFRSDI